MVSSVNSSSKAALGLATVAALGLVTVVCYLYRKNAAAQPTAPSLAQKDVSILRWIPLISSAVNYLFPAQLPDIFLGVPSKLRSLNELTESLAETRKNHGAINTLVIYGDNLVIKEDPGILALKPKKLILVGALINSWGPLETSMRSEGWRSLDRLTVMEVASEKEALEAPLEVDLVTSKPIPTVYHVRAAKIEI